MGHYMRCGGSAVEVEDTVSVEDIRQCFGRVARGRVQLGQLSGVYS